MAINPITGKVHNGPISPPSPAKTGQTGNKDSNTAPKPVDVAAVTEEIRQALEATSSNSVVDYDKVARVKQALQNGEYQINAESIAEKMLEFDRHIDST